MTDGVTDTDRPCAYCGEPGSGRFCAACGKARTAETSTHVLQEAFGMKAPAARAIGHTAWLAISRPATLSTRWAEGDRRGLSSPIAMMSTVTAVTGSIGVLLSIWIGAPDEPQAAAAVSPGNVLDLAPFLRSAFPDQFAAATLDPERLTRSFKRIGSLLAAFWPALFILPGWLALMPSRCVTSHKALIVACVETIFILMVAGVYLSITIAAPALAGGVLVGLGLPLATFAHTAVHIRNAVPCGWGFAVLRPLLAALYFTILIYLWVMLVMALALSMLPILGR